MIFGFSAQAIACEDDFSYECNQPGYQAPPPTIVYNHGTYTNTVQFQDGNSDSDSYGGGYYTSTNRLNGRDTQNGVTLHYNNLLTVGHVYRNDGWVEEYNQFTKCQTNISPTGERTTYCP